MVILLILFVLNYPMFLDPTNDVQWHAFIFYELMIYEMPMHRKNVGLRYCFYACVTLCHVSV
jgi:hypothetical protein